MDTQHSICPGCSGVIQFEPTAVRVTCPNCQMQFNGPGASVIQPVTPIDAHVVQQPQAPAPTQPWQAPASTPYHAHAAPIPLGPQHAAPTPQMNQFGTPVAATMHPNASPNFQSAPYVKPAPRSGAMIFMVLGVLALGLGGLAIFGISMYYLLEPTKAPDNVVAQDRFKPNVPVQPQPARPVFTPPEVERPDLTPPTFTPRPAPEIPAPVMPTIPVVPPPAPPTPVAPEVAVEIPDVDVVEGSGKQDAAVPAPQVPVREPATGSQVGLNYKWKTGDEHTYRITIKTERGGEEQTINGSCSYKVGGAALQGFEAEEATGTAFVVSADGYLISCAHVIEDASEVEVTIAGKRYVASVVDTNFVQDIALLRVEATGLTPLPLVDSETVQHGQEIRAVGFPLSTVLGKDVKVTKGTISGFVQEDHGKRFQIDASINPGNSGGPIVDGKGNVVGIASSKLMGVEVTSVGFAVPSNQAVEMLKRNKVNVGDAARAKTLDGPQLVQAVKPSIAFVKSSFGGAGRERFKITYRGVYTHKVPMEQSRMASRIGFGGRFGPGRLGPGRLGGGPRYVDETESATGSLRATQFGEVSDFKGDVQFPYVLGHVGMLCIEDLHHHHSRKWGSETQTELHIIERAKSDGPFGRMMSPGFNPRDPFGRSQPKDKVKESYPAVERTRYSLESETDEHFVLKKTHEFRTLEDEENPYMLIKGAGTVVVDKKLGMPKSLTYNATLVRNIENATVRIPMKVTYEWRDPVQVAEERKQALERMAKLQAEQAKKKEEAETAAKLAATVPNPAAVKALVEKISEKEVNNALVYSDIEKLSKLAIVDEQRDEVIGLAAAHLHSTHGWAAKNAGLVLLSWGDKDDHLRLLVPMVADVGKRLDFQLRPPLFTKLAEYKDEEIIKAFIMRLTVSGDAKDAAKALSTIGPACEDLLLTAFAKEEKIRKPATDVFKEVGTQKCLPVLERAELNSKSSSERNALRAAREAVQLRMKTTS